jgi:hypothetical protein
MGLERSTLGRNLRVLEAEGWCGWPTATTSATGWCC